VALNRDAAAVEQAIVDLAEAHTIVLAPGSRSIWMAHPFSAVPTLYPVVSGGTSYWANCAWDAYGIAAMIGRDTQCVARCPDCGHWMDLSVKRGAVGTTGMVHFVVPPCRFWDNVAFAAVVIGGVDALSGRQVFSVICVSRTPPTAATHGVNVVGGFIECRRTGVASGVVVLKRDSLFFGECSHDICLSDLLQISGAFNRMRRHNLMVCGSALQHNGTAGLRLRVGVTGLTGRVRSWKVCH
jgi:hypothetical protein